MRWKIVSSLLAFQPLALALFITSSLAPIHAASLPGYIRDLPPESAPSRQLRHAKVAERRSGTILITHRGACTLAPENTLEAYAAAMDYGADGCEVDIRRTADGVLVLFHDDMLDRLTDGFGKVEQLSYFELLALHPLRVFGTATRHTRPPTLAALLVLARQRAMLLFLDVKEPGLDDEVARLLDEADMWDHVVAVNTQTLPKLLQNPKLKLLRFKGGLYEARRDVDPAAVKTALAQPGQILILEDPRLAASQLKREPHQPVPLPREEFAKWRKPSAAPPPMSTNLVPAHYLRRLQQFLNPNSVKDLLYVLRPDDLGERREPQGSTNYQCRRTERILERAWAAERLGQRAKKTQQLVQILELQVQHSSLHPDWMFNGLDGHTAARALGRLRATESAPVLIATFRRVNPDLVRVRNPQFTNTPLAWVDWRKASILSALGELRCDTSKRYLQQYLALSEAEARELSIPAFEEATKALLRHQLTHPELLSLLQSSHSMVCGTAILECLDHPTPERTSALREAAPWALSLPQARHSH